MNKNQYLALLRTFLTTLGAVLATYGFTDGHAWLPVIGVALSGLSVGWGVLWHRDPAKPGKIKWSLVRKFVNALTSAAATYGWMRPDQVDGVVMLFATLGPLLALNFSLIDSADAPSEPEN